MATKLKNENFLASANIWTCPKTGKTMENKPDVIQKHINELIMLDAERLAKIEKTKKIRKSIKGFSVVKNLPELRTIFNHILVDNGLPECHIEIIKIEDIENQTGVHDNTIYLKTKLNKEQEDFLKKFNLIEKTTIKPKEKDQPKIYSFGNYPYLGASFSEIRFSSSFKQAYFDYWRELKILIGNRNKPVIVTKDNKKMLQDDSVYEKMKNERAEMIQEIHQLKESLRLVEDEMTNRRKYLLGSESVHTDFDEILENISSSETKRPKIKR